MTEKTGTVPETNWGDLDRQHQMLIGLRMTPAERLRWLENTVEELQTWVGLARRANASQNDELKSNPDAEIGPLA